MIKACHIFKFDRKEKKSVDVTHTIKQIVKLHEIHFIVNQIWENMMALCNWLDLLRVNLSCRPIADVAPFVLCVLKGFKRGGYNPLIK